MTLGAGVELLTGTIDPWSRDAIKYETAQGIEKAMGPNPDPVQLAAAKQKAYLEIDQFLVKSGQQAGDCFLRLPLVGCVAGPQASEGLKALQKFVNTLIVLAMVGGTIYVAQRFGLFDSFKKRRR